LEGALDIPACSFGNGASDPPFLELAKDLNEWHALEKVKKAKKIIGKTVEIGNVITSL
jgi:hypothetical protein